MAESAYIAQQMTQEEKPKYLYKVITVEAWKKSQDQPSLMLSDDDRQFIHFSRDDQLERIINKYWSSIPEFIVLKIDTERLPGNMVFEANPGGTAKYYHLYNGAIPMAAVIEVAIRIS